MTHPCPAEHCDRTAPGHAVVCGACEAELLRALAEVPALAAELATTLSRQGSRSPGGGGSEIPLPFDARASEAEAVLRSALVGWVRVLAESGPAAETHPADTLPEIAAWLSERRTRLLGHHAAAEAHGEITAAVRLAQRAVDRPAERAYAGPCAQCGTDLYARPGSPTATCRQCGTGHHIATQHDRMREQLADRLEHAAAAGAILRRTGVDVADSTIRYFAQKGRILTRGTDIRGRPLYRLGEIVDVLSTRKAKAG